MKAIIIDDEKQAIASLEMELKEIKPHIEVVGTAGSVQTGIKLLREITPDVLFLDIRLNDGLGFDILQEIDNFGQFHIIFTTAYDQYALEAFRHHAFDYLLKPIDPDELQFTIERIHKERFGKKQLTDNQLDQILAVSNKISGETKVALNTTDGIYLKPLSTIVHIQADGNYTKFFFTGSQKPMLISKTLKDYEDLLSSSGFVRIHYSHLININHLESYHSKDGNYVVMSNKSVLPVSTRKKANLLEVLRTKSQFLG